MGRLVAIILNIRETKKVGTLTRNLSYRGNTGKLNTPKAEKVINSILAQFNIKTKK